MIGPPKMVGPPGLTIRLPEPRAKNARLLFHSVCVSNLTQTALATPSFFGHLSWISEISINGAAYEGEADISRNLAIGRARGDHLSSDPNSGAGSWIS